MLFRQKGRFRQDGMLGRKDGSGKERDSVRKRGLGRKGG